MLPWQTRRAAEVALERMRFAHNLAMTASWHAGVLPRASKIPPLQSLLLPPPSAGRGKIKPAMAQRDGVADPDRLNALKAALYSHVPSTRIH